MVANGDLAVSSLSAQEQAQVAGPLADEPLAEHDRLRPARLGRADDLRRPRQLPTITGPLVIDGYTQAGSHPNTLAVGTDAVVLVALDGSMSERRPGRAEGHPAGELASCRAWRSGTFAPRRSSSSGAGDAVRATSSARTPRAWSPRRTAKASSCPGGKRHRRRHGGGRPQRGLGQLVHRARPDRGDRLGRAGKPDRHRRDRLLAGSGTSAPAS